MFGLLPERRCGDYCFECLVYQYVNTAALSEERSRTDWPLNSSESDHTVAAEIPHWFFREYIGHIDLDYGMRDATTVKSIGLVSTRRMLNA